MISQPKNRVQAIKFKFENLNNEPVLQRSRTQLQLKTYDKVIEKKHGPGKENCLDDLCLSGKRSNTNVDWSPRPNMSYLYKTDKNFNLNENKKLLSRQTSDPGKKLHRSHAFRCDRSQKIVSPKRHGSCHGRSESQDFSLKMEKKLSKERLKQLGNVIEGQMKKENFVSSRKADVVSDVLEVSESQLDSIPDSQVPKHILDQYAKVVKKRKDGDDNDKQDGMTDSGVSSETENLEEEKTGRIKKLMSQFEKTEESDLKNNLESMVNLCNSNDTIRLEKKNPHLVLTDTLKKALKQPLPPGPPPKKPPRAFASISESPEKPKKDAKKMLQKLEKVLQKREAQTLNKSNKNISDISENRPEVVPKNEYDKVENVKEKNDYDIAENTSPILQRIPRQVSSLKHPKEVHYLCTEILDITQRTLLPNQYCFKSLNCAITANSTLSLPYTKINNLDTHCCSQSNDKLNRVSTFLADECEKCLLNEGRDGFKCHLNCKCRVEKSKFFVNNEHEHIYDEPFNGSRSATIGARSKVSHYGTLNKTKSLEELRTAASTEEAEKIYDIPCDPSRSPTPERQIPSPESELPNCETKFPKPVAESPKPEAIYPKPETKFPKTVTESPKSDIKFRKPAGFEFPKLDNDFPTSETELPKPKPNSKFEKLRQNFETGFCDDKKKTQDKEVRKLPNRITEEKIPVKKLRSFDQIETQPTGKPEKMTEARKFATEKPPMKPKPVFAKNKRLSKSIENIADGEVDKKGTGNWKDKKKEGVRKSVSRGDTSQMDVDRENLNKLMNEIYATVTEACNMENKPGSFPTDQSDSSTSEESVKLTRSLTEKRKNYVRRVSSKVAYLEAKNVKNTRFRHQTSVCSYKSDIIDQPYSTFRSWKSFRTSQNNLSLNTSKDKMERTDSTDSKVNLTDSKGNLLSMDYDSFDSIDKLSIDGKTGCVDIDMCVDREKPLFNICLLVGLNYMTGQAYVKSVFPSQVKVPPHIENLVFPETLSDTTSGEWPAEGSASQCYSLVLTDERGERAYGYCRRVLPEGTSTCLPLSYCIISKFRAPGFYYKVLQEIESHHGSSEVEIHDLLTQLYETDFPSPGEEITIVYRNRHCNLNNRQNDLNNKNYRNSVNLGDVLKCQTLPDMRQRKSSDGKDVRGNERELHSDEKGGKDAPCDRKDTQHNAKDTMNSIDNAHLNQDTAQCNQELKNSVSVNNSEKDNDYEQIEFGASEISVSSEVRDRRETVSETLPNYFDFENNNGPRKVFLSFEGPRTKTLKRSLEPRIEENCLSTALDCLGAGLSVRAFGSLLLERKLIIVGDKLGELSSCMEAVQQWIYPLVWQQPLISAVPAGIQRDVLEAPLPVLAGVARRAPAPSTYCHPDEGMLIDLTQPSKAVLYQGDEATILPVSSYRALKTALQMEAKQKDHPARNLCIAEPFLRFFVDILGDFWKYFSFGELQEDQLGKGNVIFDKDTFVKEATPKQNQYFLEWFTETAMFNHFIQNMSVIYYQRHNDTQNTINTTNATKNTLNATENTLNDTENTLNNTENTLNDTKNTLNDVMKIVDAPLPGFYDLFLERVKNRTKNDVSKSFDVKSNYKNAVNKRVKLLKSKLRELVT